MKEGGMRQRVCLLLASVMSVTVLSAQLSAIEALPDAMVMRTGDVASVEVSLPLSAELAENGSAVIAGLDRDRRAAVSLTAGTETGTAQVVFRLLGLVPVKTMTVTVEQPRILIPGGRSLGVAVETEGVVVVGSSDLGNRRSPAQEAGIRPGDVIERIDGRPVSTAEELSACLQEGLPVTVEVLRGGGTVEYEVTPRRDPRDGVSRIGVWVRESTAGVGTLTYYDPLTGEYGALGHAITDVDTGVPFPVGEGAVYKNDVVQITRGAEGTPGELTGEFFEEEVVLGDIERNTEFGIFGSGNGGLAGIGLYPGGLPVGGRDRIHTGPAQILTTIDGEEVRAYDCEIEKLYDQSDPEVRSMVVRITDPGLLEQTGGIVQGMSGSPIIQDGHIVGAVTHVFVSDPTRGYGLYIEWMLDAAG